MTTVRLRSLVLVLAIAGGLAAAFPARGAVTAPAGTCILYTSESDDDVNLLADDFMRRTPGVTVKIFRAGSGPVEAKIEAEMQAGRIQADVIWFADIAFFQNLARKGLMLAYSPPAAGPVPRLFHYEGNQFHEVRLIFDVLGFNTRQVKFRPSSW